MINSPFLKVDLRRRAYFLDDMIIYRALDISRISRVIRRSKGLGRQETGRPAGDKSLTTCVLDMVIQEGNVAKGGLQPTLVDANLGY